MSQPEQLPNGLIAFDRECTCRKPFPYAIKTLIQLDKETR